MSSTGGTLLACTENTTRVLDFERCLGSPALETTHAMPGGGSTGTGATSIASFAAPSPLREDLTLRKPSREISKPLITKHPFVDR